MKTTKTILLSILIFLLLGGEKADASNYVKIATIGKGSPVLDKSSTLQEKVDQMIVFWRIELNQILPDQPDLIVLPEVCDQPAGLSLEEKYQYYKVRGNQFLNFLSSVAKENHCYIAFGTKRIDLNFDELRQKYAKLKPNLILFPSMYHGGLVQSYWAYSSESYFVGSIGWKPPLLL